MSKAIIDAEVILVDDPDVLHELNILLAIFVYVPRKEILHVIEKFRQMLSLFEDNERVRLYSGGNDVKDDIITIVMIEIVRNKLFAHQLLKKSMVEITTDKSISHTDQHSPD